MYISVSLRKSVYERAKNCCEYCLIPNTVVFVPHEIDHIISQKHGGQTQSDNLALSCTLCNKFKGSDIASLASTLVSNIGKINSKIKKEKLSPLPL